MNRRNLTLSMLLLMLVVGCATPTVGPVSMSEVNLIPMYGFPERQRTTEEKKADEDFIASETSSGQSREQSSKKWIGLAWKWKSKGAYDNAMRFFNLAWLMNQSNYEPYYGFGLLLGSKKPAEASAYLEKALTLVGDAEDKPYIMEVAATTYYFQAVAEKDPIKKSAIYSKANALFAETTRLLPIRVKGYLDWGFSLYTEGDYVKAWKMVNKVRELGGDENLPILIELLSKKMPEPK